MIKLRVRLIRLGYLLLVCYLSACFAVKVPAGDARMKLKGGIWLLDNKPFTGVMVESFPDANRTTEYTNGVEDGERITRASSGAILERRYFKNGKTHGVQRGWFVGGQDRYYREFTDGHYSGECWSWHENGQVSMYEKYTPEGEILVLKHWRESGQIYRNQVFAHNTKQNAGLPGVKICNYVKETVTHQ